MGADDVDTRLPPLVAAAASTGIPVLWCCDPMHGNTETADNGYKTRRFERIRTELELSFDVLASEKTHLGGVHFELTGDNVTECIGGATGIRESDLSRAYLSSVDPRLNGEQALEIAFSIVRKQMNTSG
jgi:3-deoxy-7-phosphoheptulonate synthase